MMGALVPVVLCLAAAPPSDLARFGASAAAAIRGPALSGHIRFLADDLLAGRAPGAPGHSIAALYLATQLQALGVEPAGEDGGWIQNVPLVAVRTEAARCELRVGSTADWILADGEEILIWPSPTLGATEVSGPLVFAGHGVVAPMYGYDDTPRDLRGKIAVVLGRAPRSDREDFFPSAASAVFGDWREKVRQLARRGAVAVITVPPPGSIKSYPWAERARDRGAFEEMFWMDGDRPGGGPRVPRAEMTPTAFEKLLRRAGRKETMAELLALSRSGSLRPFDLGNVATLRSSGSLRRLTAENVVGVVRGTDAVLAKEFVVFSAHLDHLGIGPAVGGDTIYNGAVDDAAGIASLIEIARAVAALGTKPARSILFLGDTAEERGEVGAEYFAHHPTVPLGAMVADVNSDDLFGRWRPFEVHAVGAEHSSLAANARSAAEALGLSFGPDPDPDQAYFVRGDQISFVRRGIPSVQPGISYRDESGDDKRNRAISDTWMEKRYHQPSDEWDPTLDYENMAIETRYYFLVGLSIALDPARPTWNPGDVFEKLFAGGPAAE